MNIFSIVCCLIIIACGEVIIAETFVDMLAYFRKKYYIDEEEES